MQCSEQIQQLEPLLLKNLLAHKTSLSYLMPGGREVQAEVAKIGLSMR